MYIFPGRRAIDHRTLKSLESCSLLANMPKSYKSLAYFYAGQQSPKSLRVFGDPFVASTKRSNSERTRFADLVPLVYGCCLLPVWQSKEFFGPDGSIREW
jgi:hypothetical protein